MGSTEEAADLVSDHVAQAQVEAALQEGGALKMEATADEANVDLTDSRTTAQVANLVRRLSIRSTTPFTIDDFDNEALELGDGFSLDRYLHELIRRVKYEGHKTRHAGVVFKGITVEGAGDAVKFASDVVTALLSPLQIFSMFSKKPHKQILMDVTGHVRQGEMLLVLGRPGAGCSTFLKCIAAEKRSFASVKGDIHYNGIPQAQMQRNFRGEITYNPEVDTHFPHMTVAQTIGFAAACRAPHHRLGGGTRSKYIDDARDLISAVLGLRHVYNTKVGDDFVRGVSGGERKRVSIAEGLSTRSVVQCWDNSTRGLDASTALEFASALRTVSNLVGSCALVAIYQAGENIYQLFDKVTVLYEGRQIYYGHADSARAYFEAMGFEPQLRQTTADFLTAVTDSKGRFIKAGATNVPESPDDFVRYWKASDAYKLTLAEIEAYETEYPVGGEALGEFQRSRQEEQARHLPKSSPYTISFPMQLRICVKRSYQRILGDMAFIIASFIASIFQSLIMGSLFYDISNDTSGFFSRGGVLFFAVLFQSLQSMSEIVNFFSQRPIIQRHNTFALYRPSADALAQIFADIPIKLIIITLFDLILYFMTNLFREPAEFFTFWLFTFMVTLVMIAFFRMLAACTRDVSEAQVLSGIGILALVIYTGYMIPRPTMHNYFKWISYINPRKRLLY